MLVIELLKVFGENLPTLSPLTAELITKSAHSQHPEHLKSCFRYNSVFQHSPSAHFSSVCGQKAVHEKEQKTKKLSLNVTWFCFYFIYIFCCVYSKFQQFKCTSMFSCLTVLLKHFTLDAAGAEILNCFMPGLYNR